jgi:hypothetical protein
MNRLLNVVLQPEKFQKLEILFLNNLYDINSSFRLLDTNNLSWK